MEKFRIGNDLTVFWAILDDDSQPYDLSGKTVKIFLTHPRGRMEITEDVNIQGNVISWLFRGRQQRYLGVYKLTVEIFSSPTTRVLRRDIDQAFSLVSATLYVEESNGRPEINETGKLTLSTILEVYQIMPIVPHVGPNGNWWIDGIDTGKPSTGMSAYEFAKENGYTGTEAEYAAECAAVPTLNEESRVATAAASEAAGNADRAAGEASRSATVANKASATATNAAEAANTAAEAANTAAEAANTAAESSMEQIEAVGQYIGNEVTPAAEAAKQAATKAINAAEAANDAAGSINGATDNANSAADAANAAATRAERAIEEFGPAIANKADLENGKIIASQLPDYILGQVMFGGIIYADTRVLPSNDFSKKYPEESGRIMTEGLHANDHIKFTGCYFIVAGEIVNASLFGNEVSTGDWIISTRTGWAKVDNSDAVTSVAGLVGNVNASSLAAALADLTDSNSLARKTDLPKKLSELENDIEIGGGGGPYDDSEIKEILSTIVDEEGYLYSNGEKVDMRFTRSLLPVGTSIPAKANLNSKTYLKIGKYYCSLNADAKTITNCPTSEAFSMEVFNPLGTNVDDEDTRDYTYRLRVLTAYKTGVQYIQYCATSGTPGSWTYNGWFVVPRTSFSLASSKNGGTAAKGASNRGIYIDSTGTFQQMGYTVAKSVPSNAVFTDTNTKVTSVGNHYAPAEDEAQQIDAPDGEVVTGVKRDAAGHVVGVVSAPYTGGNDSYDDTELRQEIALRNVGAIDVEGETEVPDVQGGGAPSATNITYSELVGLRNNGALVAGSYYRITDYITTTAQDNTKSAGHPFDVIVLALNNNTLAEEAYAIQSARDTDGYFANSNLAAWKLWYSLDNDTERFAWADVVKLEEHITSAGETKFNFTISGVNYNGSYYALSIGEEVYVSYGPPIKVTLTNDNILLISDDSGYLSDGNPIIAVGFQEGNGKGVIYRMIDEWNNDLPYDFKNIQYEDKQGFTYSQWGKTSVFSRDENLDKTIDGVQYYGYTTPDTPNAWSDGKCWITDTKPSTTSSLYNEDGSTISYGGSITSVSHEYRKYYTFAEADDLKGRCYGNVIKPYLKNGVQNLNKICFGNNCCSNTFGNDCYSNTFGNDCHSNIFDNDCAFNTFGNNCDSNSFGNGCSYNSFGDSCYSNTFGNNCDSNSFGNNCYSNSFGNDCGSNNFGSYCYSNSFGNDCGSNNFGSYCYSNSFDSYCYSNSFYGYCYSNSFGSGCDSNSVGYGCTYNRFGNNSRRNALRAYYRYITFGEGVYTVTLENEDGGDSENQVQNYRVANGTHHQTVNVTRNTSYETLIGMDSKGNLKMLCVSDTQDIVDNAITNAITNVLNAAF